MSLTALFPPPRPNRFAGVARRAARRLILRPFDRAFDARLPSETSGKVAAQALGAVGASARHAVEYAPTSGRLFQAMLTSFPDDLSGYAFIDFGSGKGRVLCLAARYPFRAVVGVELSELLHRQSLANLAAVAEWPDRRCGDLGAVRADALAWAIPEGPCFFYLYNPFGAPVLERLLARVRASWLAAPRAMRFAYYNPVHRELFEAADFLRPRAPSWRCRAALAVASHGLALYETP